MKAIIYAGIGLFCAASVYGLADYYGSSKNGSIKKMYVEDTPAPAPEAVTAIKPDPVKTESAIPAELKVSGKKKLAAKKAPKKIQLKDFSRARIPDQQIEEMKKALPEEKLIEKSDKKDAILKTEKVSEVKPETEVQGFKQKG